MHNGDDYGGSFPVLVAADGVVVRVGASLSKRSGFGYYVIIEHRALGLRTLYAHGAHRSKLIRGRAVKRGAGVFQSGTTGASTGNHLHFEVHERDQFGRWRPVDPAGRFGSFAGSKPVPIPEIQRRQKMMSIVRVIRKGVGEHFLWVSPTRVSLSVELSTASKDDRAFWFRVAEAQAAALGQDGIPVFDDSNNGGWFLRNDYAFRASGMPASFPLSPTNSFNAFAGVSATATVDEEAIAAAVEARLQDDFAGLPAATRAAIVK